MNNIETWIAVGDYPDYEVSDMGNVRRIKINSKLSQEDVASCRKMRDAGMLYREIAEKFGVTYVAVRVALTYKPKRGSHRQPYRLLKPQHNTSGYLAIMLCKDGIAKSHRIHKLVADAFLGPANGRQVNHKNGIKDDPRLGNLEYVSCRENALHYHGVLMRGKKRIVKPKTHCIRGHEFMANSTYFRPNGWRCCKLCNPKGWPNCRA